MASIGWSSTEGHVGDSADSMEMNRALPTTYKKNPSPTRVPTTQNPVSSTQTLAPDLPSIDAGWESEVQCLCILQEEETTNPGDRDLMLMMMDDWEKEDFQMLKCPQQ